MTANTKEIDQRTKESKDKAFADYLAKPETKLMLSMVSPQENPDLLQTLLRGAFDSGHSAGQGNVLSELITSMLKAPRRDGPAF